MYVLDWQRILRMSLQPVYFSGFNIWEGVSHHMGVKLFFPSAWYNVQFYNKTAKYSIIPALLLGALLTVCNQRLYLLAQLKRQGLDLSALYSVLNAIIANKILYALPV